MVTLEGKQNVQRGSSVGKSRSNATKSRPRIGGPPEVRYKHQAPQGRGPVGGSCIQEESPPDPLFRNRILANLDVRNSVKIQKN